MKAGEASLLEFLQCSRTGQYVVPIFQRPYSWTLKECRQLWKDIGRIAQDSASPGHFMGSVVFAAKGPYRPTGISRLMLIDGQQRLATVTLLLAALRERLPDNVTGKDLSRKKIDDYYLFNEYGQDGERYRLALTRGDNETLVSILETKEPPSNYSVRLLENYRYFVSEIRESSLEPQAIFEGLSKLMIVDITLEKDDDAQLIYESLNSTGLELTQMDLVRNYVLMNLDVETQSKLYSHYWYPMEQDFEREEQSDGINRYMKDYLTLKTGTIPRVDEVYFAFKDYSSRLRASNVEELVKDIRSFSKHFTSIAFARSDDDEIRHLLTRIGELKVEVSFPFLIQAMDDWQNNAISKEEFVEILRLAESYVFRRAICGMAPNSLNKTFAGLMRMIDRSSYMESLKAVFILMDDNRKFPTDEEFQESLMNRDVYKLRVVDYLLGNLENHGRKERIVTSEFTIEHIMPQNPALSDEWLRELGDEWQRVHTTYLHRIGNLTLTGYNTELSDRSFVEKRDMKGGFKDSPIRLNAGLRDLEHWNEDEIKKRSTELASLAVKIWPYPTLAKELVEKYRKETGPRDRGGHDFSAQRYELRKKFWGQFLEKAASKGFSRLSGQNPTHYYSIGFKSLMKGVYFDFYVHVAKAAEIDLYIYASDKQMNRSLFDHLRLKKDKIETVLESPLIWRRQDEKHGCRVIWGHLGLGLNDGEGKWDATQESMLASMQRFVAVIEPEIAAFKELKGLSK